MTNARNARLEQYRNASRRADKLAASGKCEEALEVLRENLTAASAHGDEDYQTLFEAEILNYSEPDYPRQIALLQRGISWLEQEGLPPDAFLFRTMGAYHSLKGDEDAAIVWYDKALEIDPKDYDAMRNTGVSLTKKGDLDTAIEWYDKGLEINPKNYDAMRERGAALSNKGDFDAAIEWFDKALEINPNDSIAMRNRGVALSKKGDEDGAIEWFDNALEIDPKDYDAMRERGVAIGNRGDLDGSIEWFDKALEINPKDSIAMRERGAAIGKRGDSDASIEWCDKALKINPKDYRAMRNRGVSLSQKGDLDAAIEWFDKALKINPKDYNAMRSRGVALSKKGDEDGAIEWYDKALKINPKDSDAMRQRGVSLSNKGDEDAAIEWYDKALEINPKDSIAMGNRAVSLSNMGDEDAAIEWFDRALKINPKDYDVMRERGVAIGKTGDLDASIEWFDKALEINPKDYDAMRNRGVSLSKKGDEDAAMEWFDKALEINPKDYNAMRQRAVSLSNKGEEDAAIEWFDKALKANPEDAMAYRNWAVSELKRKHLDAAMEKIAKAATLAPEERRSDFNAFCKIAGRDADEEWQTLFPEDEPAAETPEDVLGELSAFIGFLRGAFGDKADEYREKKAEGEQARQKFLEPSSCLADGRSLLLVLRKWNSYTPAIPTGNEDERNPGGGYFLWHNGHGTVVDPGYNFIENFSQAGCRLCDIDNVILTHAHNDHTNDFEALRTLLHEFNEKRKKDEKGPSKKVRFFVNNGSFRKFAGLLDLKEGGFSEHLYTLNPGGEFELLGGGRFRVLPAYHDEVFARDQAVGLLFTLDIENQPRRILLTSDTGLFPLKQDLPDLVPDTKDAKSEVWHHYLAADGEAIDVMIVHIGSIRDRELQQDAARDPATACYPNHLGIIGTSRVIAMCRPRLAVISEFGEEMKQFRVDLIRGLQEKVFDLLFSDHDTVPRIVPGDLPFIYDLGANTFLDCVSRDWVDMEKMAFGEGDGDDSDTVYYFSVDRKTDFTEDPRRYTRLFQQHRESRDGLYFAEQ